MFGLLLVKNQNVVPPIGKKTRMLDLLLVAYKNFGPPIGNTQECLAPYWSPTKQAHPSFVRLEKKLIPHIGRLQNKLDPPIGPYF